MTILFHFLYVDMYFFSFYCRAYRSLQRTPARKKTTSQSSSQPPPRISLQRKFSDPDLYRYAEPVRISKFLKRSVGSVDVEFIGLKTC